MQFRFLRIRPFHCPTPMTPSIPLEIEIDAADVERGSAAARYDVSYDRSHQPSLVVVSAVATLEEIDPTELRPLHDAIDADALDRLVEGDWRRSAHLCVSFTYEGYDVEFRRPGRIHLERLE